MRMKSKAIILTLLLAMTSSLSAQLRVDINMFGRSESEGLESGYTAWTFGRVTSAEGSPSVDFSNVEVAKREFYTLDGKKVESMRSHETYVMRITDTKGNIHSVKIIKD